MSRRSEICFCSAVRRIVLTHTRHEISITSILAPRNTVSKRVKHHFRPLITRTQTCYQINYRVFYRKNIFARNRKLKSKYTIRTQFMPIIHFYHILLPLA